jgi:hypothetical protein
MRDQAAEPRHSGACGGGHRQAGVSGKRDPRPGDRSARLDAPLHHSADRRPGAILLTGYLGGAVASNVRVQEGWFAILFPVFFGALIWGGLYLRDARLRALIPLRS